MISKGEYVRIVNVPVHHREFAKGELHMLLENVEKKHRQVVVMGNRGFEEMIPLSMVEHAVLSGKQRKEQMEDDKDLRSLCGMTSHWRKYEEAVEGREQAISDKKKEKQAKKQKAEQAAKDAALKLAAIEAEKAARKAKEPSVHGDGSRWEEL